MLREIRGLEQRKKREIRRWFQDDYFDLFVTQDEGGEVQWFQLCYARDTWRERVLEWRRGRGFQHMKLRERPNPITNSRLQPRACLPVSRSSSPRSCASTRVRPAGSAARTHERRAGSNACAGASASRRGCDFLTVKRAPGNFARLTAPI
jgi:hypothetical protein